MRKYLLILSSLLFFLFPVNKTQAQDVVSNGGSTQPISFPASPCVYKWTNNATSIGLAASGTGNIPSFTAVNTGSSPVTATIIGTPVPPVGFAYITNVSSNTLSVINLSTGATVASIGVGVFPGAVTISPDGTRVYVANNTSNSLSVINTATNTLITAIPLPSAPAFMAINPDGSRIYITNQLSGTVSIIDTTTNSVISSFTVSSGDPLGILVSPDGSSVYITVGSNQVLVFDTATNNLVASIAVGAEPIDLAQSPDGKLLYVSNYMGGSISVINTTTDMVVSTIACGSNPYGITISSDGSTLYVANALTSSPGSVTIINTASGAVENTINLGFDPYGIDLSPDNSLLYVEPVNGSNMVAISTANNSIVSNIPVSSPFSFGHFIGGVRCGPPVTYTITVDPTGVLPPTVTATPATGTISACAGTASVSPNIQQFTVSGSDLTGSITATAPPGGAFEVSLAAGSGYGGSVTIPQNSGIVSGTVVYVRSAATASAGSISGNVTLTSAGASNQTVAVTGTVNALPTVSAVANQTVNNGVATAAVNFAGTGNTFTWVNDTPGIGLAASGTGNIASFTAVNTGISPVKATITVTPINSGFAFIANGQSNNVSVISTATNTIEATIPVGTEPYGVAVTPDGSRAYVTNYQSGTVSVISAVTNTVIATIPVGANPIEITMSPDGSRVYVGMPNTTSVTVISTATNSVIGSINLSGYIVNGLSVSPDGKWLYATGPNLNAVLIVNLATNAIVTTISVGGLSGVFDVAASPVGNRVYVTGGDNNNLLVINSLTNTLIATIPLGYPALGCAVSPDGSRVYVTNEYNNLVSVINTANNTVVTTIPVGISPDGISVSPDGSSVYVANAGSNSVSVISTSTNTVTKTVAVGQSPASVGNFISAGTNCTGVPVSFTITVDPGPPTIITSIAAGTISACMGAASAPPYIQQITVSGSGLTGGINATAPPGFEVSLAAGSGYGNSLTIPQTSGTADSTVVYVRSAAGPASGNISGNVTLTSAGASNQTVAVTGIVNALPTVNAVADQTVNNGAATAAINFTNTGNTVNWVNDTPGIGLAASGTGNIASFTAINTGSVPISATISATASTGVFAYIANSIDGTVSVINTESNKVVALIPVGLLPWGASVSPDGSRVYITNALSASVSVINTADNSVIATINVDQRPYGICVSPNGSFAYVGNTYSSSVSVINTATNTVVADILDIGDSPYGIAMNPEGTTAYVSTNSGSVVVINTATNTVTSKIIVDPFPEGLAVSPDGTRLYVATNQAGTVQVINTKTNQVLGRIYVGTNPAALVISPDGKTVYVANYGSNTVSVINTQTNTVVATVSVPVNSQPEGLSLNADGTLLYVTNQGAADVSIISTATNAIVATVPVGTGPNSLGNFITQSSSCGGAPVKFTITVNPSPPAITASVATGTISACAGAASVSPQIQQFSVSGSHLTGNIAATAPPGFEVSLVAGSGYSGSVTIPQTSGTVSNTVIYVRSAASLANGTTTANVLLTSPGAPGQTVSVTATVTPLVTPSVVIAASVNNICAGIPVTFTATPTNGGSSPVYQWLLNGNNAGTNSPAFSSSTLANGDMVDCVMTGSASCLIPATATSNSITMNVSAAISPSVSIAASQNNICAGTLVTFTATPVNGGSTPVYQWLVNGNNAGANSPTFSGINFADGDVVSCVMTGSAACAVLASATSNSISISVSVLINPSISIAASQNNICAGAGVTFTATPTNGGSAPVYQWLLNGNNTGTNSPTFASTALSNGDVISCRLTSDAICVTIPGATSNNITMIVNAQTVPTVSINASANGVCAGTPVTFTASPGSGGNAPVYQWLLNGNDTGTNSTTFNGSTLANGDVVSCVMTSSSACATPATAVSNNIVMNIFPLPVINGGGSKTIEKGSSVVLTAIAPGNVADITWSPLTGLDNNKILNPKASPATTTVYTITVQTAQGCMAMDSVTVTVLYGITIPNTFTPNGDGVNDKWNIQNLNDYQNCMVSIFDRYGGEVFSSKGYNSPWDGTLKGRPCPVGTYYYLINLNDGTPPLSGFVALIR